MSAAHDLSMQVSTAYRLQHMGLEVDGVKLDFGKYPYLTEIIDQHAPRITIIKGAQMGFTIACILRCMEDMIHNRLRGTGYFFPDVDGVMEFAKARFAPIMEQPAYAHLHSSVDTAGVKQVNKGYIYFRAAGQRGGQKDRSLSKMKSVPFDRLYLDEYDEMEPRRIDAALHRLDGSEFPEVVGLSTPTLPEYGVDLDYKRSDMRAWHWRCDRCNGWTCLEETWPDCIAEPTDKDPFYVCSKCHEELDRRTGQWVATKPDVIGHRGYYVSQLGSWVKSAGRVLQDLEDSERKGRMREFYNQVLARPFADIEDVLTDALLNACLDRDRPRARRATGPCAMGVDVGAHDMHYVVGVRVTDRDSHIYDWGRVESFDDIGQIAKRFNVVAGVMDIGAETRKVREFIQAHSGWWGCQYTETRKAGYDWNQRTKVVTVGRTEALDASHNAVVERRVTFPAPDETYHEVIAPQMKNLARTKIEDSETGNVKMRWVVVGGQKDDHIKHAHTYFEIAAGRAPLCEQVQKAVSSRQLSGRRPRNLMTL